jgi:hypothetical protein
MTTPERLRRRQLIESAMLIVVGILMIIQSYYFHHEDREQRECLSDNFVALSEALDIRSELVSRETAATKRIWLTYAEAAGVVKDDPTQELPPKEKARLQRKLVAALLDYERVIEDIERERRENPLPPYPVGVCTEK